MQPNPKPNNFPSVWSSVIQDMSNRNQVGIERYGTPLQPFNGRNSLQDVYEDLLDACVYIKQRMIEEKASNDLLHTIANSNSEFALAAAHVLGLDIKNT